MAERNVAGQGDLPVDPVVPARRALRPDFADAPCGRVDPFKHRGRTGPENNGEFVQFVSMAEGSLAELDTQVQLAVDLAFCDEGTAEPVWALLVELKKMLNAPRRTLLHQ